MPQPRHLIAKIPPLTDRTIGLIRYLTDVVSLGGRHYAHCNFNSCVVDFTKLHHWAPVSLGVLLGRAQATRWAPHRGAPRRCRGDADANRWATSGGLRRPESGHAASRIGPTRRPTMTIGPIPRACSRRSNRDLRQASSLAPSPSGFS